MLSDLQSYPSVKLFHGVLLAYAPPGVRATPHDSSLS